MCLRPSHHSPHVADEDPQGDDPWITGIGQATRQALSQTSASDAMASDTGQWHVPLRICIGRKKERRSQDKTSQGGRLERPYWGLTNLGDTSSTFPPCSSPGTTKRACEEWGVTPCPLKPGYWDRTLQECRFAPKFQRWLLRSITEGVNLGNKGEP